MFVLRRLEKKIMSDCPISGFPKTALEDTFLDKHFLEQCSLSCNLSVLE